MICGTLMVKTVEKCAFHYYNPLETETVQSEHLFTVPRLCGYEVKVPEDKFCIYGVSRGPQKRALFKYTLSGEGCLNIRGESHKLQAGTAFLLNGPDDYCYELPPGSASWEFLFISFWNPIAVRLIHKIIEECGNVFPLNASGETVRTAWALYNLFKSGGIADKYSVAAMGYNFLMLLNREVLQVDNNDRNQLIQKISNYCYRNLNKVVTVEELAEYCGYSRWHFSKIFHEIQGIPPSEFIMDIKLNPALQILQHEPLSIKELAFRCGFNDQGYFTRRFRQKFGVPPTRFTTIR